MKKPSNYNEMNSFQRKICREEYIIEQNGKCYHCKSDLKESPPKDILDIKIKHSLFPESFFKYPLHLHHDHKTGMTIGTVHNLCNAVLWQVHCV
jgi:hypothetical protein